MVTPPLPHYVLAGGASRRFGSDKARHVVDGRPMVVRVAEALAPVASRTVAVAREADAYTDLGLPTIADTADDAGPLAGLHAALRHARYHADTTEPEHAPTWLLLSSCDLIAPGPWMVQPLLDGIDAYHRAAVLSGGDRFEPFPGLYHTDLLPTVEAQLHTGDRSLQSLLRSLRDASDASDALFSSPLPNADGPPLDADRPGDLPPP